MHNLYQRHLLRLLDFSTEEITFLLNLANNLKQEKKTIQKCNI